MKALTVRQPYAWAIVAAGKDIENRDWRTRFRGWIAIHAAAGRMRPLSELPPRMKRPREEALIRGAIVGLARIDDVVDRSRSKWFEGDWGWVIGSAYRLKRPVPCKGSLSLWAVPPVTERAIRRQLPKRVREAL